mgnify:CR=1 FL=1
MENWMVKNIGKVIEEEGKPVRVLRNDYGYEITEGQWTNKFRRVTAVLNAVAKPALMPWACKMVAEYAWEHREAWSKMDKAGALKALKGSPWEKRDTAGVRGTHVHNSLDDFHKGKEYHEGLTAEETEMVNNTIRLLQRRNETTLGSEIIVYNKTYDYAGTFDLWTHDGLNSSWILDYKTSKGIYPGNALQLSAYQNAEFAVLKMKPVRQSTGVEVWEGIQVPWDSDWAENLGIIHVTEKESLLYPIIASDVYWETFKAAATIKGFTSDRDSFRGRTPKVQTYDNPLNNRETKNHDK